MYKIKLYSDKKPTHLICQTKVELTIEIVSGGFQVSWPLNTGGLVCDGYTVVDKTGVIVTTAGDIPSVKGVIEK